MALCQQQPVIASMFHQPPARLHQALLQVGQRPPPGSGHPRPVDESAGIVAFPSIAPAAGRRARSDRPYCFRARPTAQRRRSGLRSFPGPHPARLASPATTPPPAASTACFPSPAPAAIRRHAAQYLGVGRTAVQPAQSTSVSGRASPGTHRK